MTDERNSSIVPQVLEWMTIKDLFQERLSECRATQKVRCFVQLVVKKLFSPEPHHKEHDGEVRVYFALTPFLEKRWFMW